ncbi:hypothetical protein ATO12_09975 [Aquimarina atlantica]|uniref:Uncharacterized protein n=1 Tax=Aquimarina atlantica TaxID=1317122 RepID=A0A023BYI0_9FLAO|nr:hypothetical protein [Aquimarina atlantica]EZH75045.1 hypothetical protein ATO12_09975 [Aquimarina atlantica]
METTTTNTSGLGDSQTWEVSVDKNSIFTNDDVIDAYLKGKKEGIKETKQIFVDKLNENINKSAVYTDKMLSFLKKRKLNPISAHLKIKSFNDFVILITLPEDEFISEDFLVSYDFAATIEEEVTNDKYYNLMFLFSDRADGQFNTSLLVSDGFFMDYKMSETN